MHGGLRYKIPVPYSLYQTDKMSLLILYIPWGIRVIGPSTPCF